MNQPTIQTNRDLYLAIARLIKQVSETERSLEFYLLALLKLAQEFKQCETLTTGEFFALLQQAFEIEPLAFDNTWRGLEYQRDLTGFVAWQQSIIHQIVDLREMDENGTLQDKQRYFGVDAPSGARWYNFDPATFLECAATGTYGGWEESDDTGRVYVPGKVMVVNEQGQYESVDPREIEDPIIQLTRISWEEFREFLWMGRDYE
jgi:hypothetical protein